MKQVCAYSGCPHKNEGARWLRRPIGVESEGRWFCRRSCLVEFLTDRCLESLRQGARTHGHRLRLGLLLQKHNLVAADQLQAALEQQKTTMKRLGRILVESGYITEKELQSVLAVQAGMAPVTLDPQTEVRLAELQPPRLLQACPFVCFAADAEEKSLSLAVPDGAGVPHLLEYFTRLLPGWQVRFFLEEDARIRAILRQRFPDLEFAPAVADGGGEIVDKTVLQFIEFLHTLEARDIRVEPQESAIVLRAETAQVRLILRCEKK